jgi:hypothetical protein
LAVGERESETPPASSCLLKIGDIVIFDLVQQGAVADFQVIGRLGAVALCLL